MDSRNPVHTDPIMLSVHHQQPWLDERGFKLSAEQLKVVSQCWDADTWARYLVWYESPLAETLVEPHIYEKQLDKTREHIFVHAEQNADDGLRDKIAAALSSLTPRQLEVITLIYWQGKSTRKVADILRLSQSTVADLKRRSLKKIAAALKGVPLTSHTMGGLLSVLPETGALNGQKVLGLADGDFPQAG